MINYNDEMGKLKAKHGLSYTHNPGGGELWRSDIEGTCQIGCQDDKKDYIRLLGWLIDNGLEEVLP